jgi:hypothetical protein
VRRHSGLFFRAGSGFRFGLFERQRCFHIKGEAKKGCELDPLAAPVEG